MYLMYLIDRKIFIGLNGRLYVVGYKATYAYSIVQHLSSSGAPAPAAGTNFRWWNGAHINFRGNETVGSLDAWMVVNGLFATCLV